MTREMLRPATSGKICVFFIARQAKRASIWKELEELAAVNARPSDSNHEIGCVAR